MTFVGLFGAATYNWYSSAVWTSCNAVCPSTGGTQTRIVACKVRPRFHSSDLLVTSLEESRSLSYF
jgi:hypothetical protein